MSHNELIAHAIKAITYRFMKATGRSTENFGNYKMSSHTRSPNEILNHMYDLVVKTMTMLQEGHFNSSLPEVLDFESEHNRLIDGLQKLQKMIDTTLIEDEVSKRLLHGTTIIIAR